MGTKLLRTALFAGSALAAAVVGVSLAGTQEASTSDASPQIDFTDAQRALAEGPALNLNVRNDRTERFAPQPDRDPSDPHAVELELAAGGGNSPVDVSIAQRASFGNDGNGEVDRQGRGSELRIGRGLVRERESGGNSTYVFVASDNEALTWQPGSRSDFGGRGASVNMQENRVEVGDMSAGVTYERNGIQASLAYVEREESTQVGNQSFSQDQSFTGITVTMRH